MRVRTNANDPTGFGNIMVTYSLQWTSPGLLQLLSLENIETTQIFQLYSPGKLSQKKDVPSLPPPNFNHLTFE